MRREEPAAAAAAAITTMMLQAAKKVVKVRLLAVAVAVARSVGAKKRLRSAAVLPGSCCRCNGSSPLHRRLPPALLLAGRGSSSCLSFKGLLPCRCVSADSSAACHSCPEAGVSSGSSVQPRAHDSRRQRQGAKQRLVAREQGLLLLLLPPPPLLATASRYGRCCRRCCRDSCGIG